ncbi:hypothetical protein N9242_00740 [Vicingaceae bacterium]|jgi:hypothetical protein|nr:hypothetical protein [Vicingaceae bacterium]
MKTFLLLIAQLFLINSLFSEVRATYNNNVVGISWANPLHIDIDYFVIEKSKNGKKFKEVLKIKGTTNLNKSIAYYEIDNTPFNKKGYYRIKQVDITGYIYYSNVVLAKNIATAKPIFNLFSPSKKNQGLKNYKGSDILVVLQNSKQEEFIARVDIVEEGNKLITTYVNVKLPAGNYIVTSTSDDKIYGKTIDVNGSYTNSAYTLSTK